MSKSKKQSPPKRKRRAAFSVAEIDQFCLEFCLRKSVTAAAESLGIPLRSAKRLKASPRFEERFKIVSEKVTNQLVKKGVDDFVLRIEDVDQNLFRINSMQYPHDFRGYSDAVKAGETLYRRMGAIQPMRVTQNAIAQSAAGTTNPGLEPPPPLPHLYQAPWRKALLEAQTVKPEPTE